MILFCNYHSVFPDRLSTIDCLKLPANWVIPNNALHYEDIIRVAVHCDLVIWSFTESRWFFHLIGILITHGSPSCLLQLSSLHPLQMGPFPIIRPIYLVSHFLSGLSLNHPRSLVFCYTKAPVCDIHSFTAKGFATVEFSGFVWPSRLLRGCAASTPHRSDAQTCKASWAFLTCDPGFQWYSVVMFLVTLIPSVWPICLLRPHSWLRWCFGLDLCALNGISRAHALDWDAEKHRSCLLSC